MTADLSLAVRRPALPPLALYVHLPWCERKCPYCDFNSYQAGTGFDERRYVAALERDLVAAEGFAAGRAIESVFFGGGTPSLVSPSAIGRVLDAVSRGVGLAPGAEITLEANPGSAERDRFEGYRRVGVNRLSLGIQSFRNDRLEALGRVHDARDAARAIEAVGEAGFANYNLDLMFGLPGDTVGGAMADLDAALAFSPAHLSWYQLTLEPGTAFAARPPPLPCEAVLAEIERAGNERLGAAGLRRYEISAWSLPGAEARHNLNYWRFGDYLGIGAGAHGKVTDAAAGRILRTVRPRHPERFMRCAGHFDASEIVAIAGASDRATEYLMNALRLTAGFTLGEFTQRSAVPAAALEAAIDRVREAHPAWIALEHDRVSALPEGINYLDSLLVELSRALESALR